MLSESKDEPAGMQEENKGVSIAEPPAADDEAPKENASEEGKSAEGAENKGTDDKIEEEKEIGSSEIGEDVPMDDATEDNAAEKAEKTAVDADADADGDALDNDKEETAHEEKEEAEEVKSKEEEGEKKSGDEEDTKGDEEDYEEDNDNSSIRSMQTGESRVHHEPRSKPQPRYAIPDYLDRSTINSIKKYLSEFEVKETLDEDVVVQLWTKTDRNVEHRARYYSNPLDDIVDEEKMHKDFKKEEEEYLVGHDFIKAMTSSLNAKRRRNLDKRTVNWVKRAAGLNRKDYHSPHSALGRDANDSDEPGGRSAPRRYTRGMAKTTRIKKQEEFVFKDNLGLKSILDAIEEMEPESGPYPVPFECARARARAREKSPRRQAGRKRAAPAMRRPPPDSDDESMKARRQFDPTLQHPLVARISEEDSLKGQSRARGFLFGDNRDILLTKIIVNGEHVSEDEEDRMSIRERKRELKRLRDRQYQKRRRDRKLAARREGPLAPKGRYTTPVRSNKGRTLDYDSETDDDRRPRRELGPSMPTTVSRSFPASSSRKRALRGPVSLSLLDWQRRQIWTPGKKARRVGDRDVHASVTIPEHLKRAGISYRLPPWESVNPASNISDLANHAEPPRTRHSDDVYASWCHKLINCLNGGARSWAIKEFFYSDLDKPWYDSNPLAKEVAKLGILPGTKLTRREWSVVRRMIRRRPRRFSKRFILAQLRDRNRFRNMARKFQANPDESNPTGFAIPARIRVGATVTAYNKKFLILHRGVVLFHDVATAKYLVQFERKELGFEFCSDTEVSSHGVPDILMPAAPTRLTGSPHESTLTSFDETGALPYGTSFGPLSVAKAKDPISCEKEVTNLLAGVQPSLEKVDAENEDAARAALVEKVTERETLVSLMTIIDAATTRKAMLLGVMEKFNALLVDRLPFGAGPPANHVISGYFERHFAWLRANLEITNNTLERAVGFLKVMYGKAYSSTSTSNAIRKERIKKEFIETVLTQDRRLCGGPPSATLHWIAALHHGSNDVGNYLSSLVLQDKALCREDGPDSKTDPTHAATDGESGETFLRSRIAAAGSVLSVIGYCCGRSGESDITLPDGDPPLVDVILASSAANLPRPAVSTADIDEGVQKALDERAAAEKELKESFALLGKEFTGLAFASRAKSRAL